MAAFAAILAIPLKIGAAIAKAAVKIASTIAVKALPVLAKKVAPLLGKIASTVGKMTGKMTGKMAAKMPANGSAAAKQASVKQAPAQTGAKMSRFHNLRQGVRDVQRVRQFRKRLDPEQEKRDGLVSRMSLAAMSLLDSTPRGMNAQQSARQLSFSVAPVQQMMPAPEAPQPQPVPIPARPAMTAPPQERAPVFRM